MRTIPGEDRGPLWWRLRSWPRLWRGGAERSRQDDREIFWIIQDIRSPYSDNPRRRDWPSVLRSIGFWPEKAR